MQKPLAGHSCVCDVLRWRECERFMRTREIAGWSPVTNHQVKQRTSQQKRATTTRNLLIILINNCLETFFFSPSSYSLLINISFPESWSILCRFFLLSIFFFLKKFCLFNIWCYKIFFFSVRAVFVWIGGHKKYRADRFKLKYHLCDHDVQHERRVSGDASLRAIQNKLWKSLPSSSTALTAVRSLHMCINKTF